MNAIGTLRPALPADPATSRPGAGASHPGAGGPAGTSGRHRNRRWLRLVLPLTVVGLVGILSAVAYAVEQPSTTNAAFLSPGSADGIGASRLAGRLTAKGVTVQRETRSADALVSAHRGDATLLLPAPALMHPFYLRMLKLLPESTNVVVVAPNGRTLANGRIPVGVADKRIAARAVPPGCAFAPATAAGTAGIARIRFGPVDDTVSTPLYRCYAGALVGYRKGAAEITLVGAADIFRNDRIDERGNAELAVALLSRSPRVVWLDLHRAEPPPGVTEDPALAGASPAPASLRPGAPGSPASEGDFPMPSGSADALDPVPGSDNGGDGGSNPLWQAFPPSVFASAALLGLAGLLFALARGRRLAAPVPEPLPVAVRATETVEGRGRLYQRARARTETLATLQHAARTRLARLLDLPADPPSEVLVPAVATATGWSSDAVTATLYPPAAAPAERAPRAQPAGGTEPARATDDGGPADDPALVRAAVALETLMHAVTRHAPPTAVPEGDPR